MAARSYLTSRLPNRGQNPGRPVQPAGPWPRITPSPNGPTRPKPGANGLNSVRSPDSIRLAVLLIFSGWTEIRGAYYRQRYIDGAPWSLFSMPARGIVTNANQQGVGGAWQTSRDAELRCP